MTSMAWLGFSRRATIVNDLGCVRALTLVTRHLGKVTRSRDGWNSDLRDSSKVDELHI